MKKVLNPLIKAVYFSAIVFIFMVAACHSNKSGAPLQTTKEGVIKLAWEANTVDDIAGYRIHFGTASKQYDEVVDVGNTTTYTLSNLTTGQTYYISITAYDRFGNESEAAKEVVGKAK